LNKIEARALLVLITFFASIQYVFIEAVKDDYSPFGFLSVTNLIGFVMMLLVFAGNIVSEIYRMTKKDVIHSIILALELTGFNVFTLIGVSGAGATVSACILSSYFIFIPVIALFQKQNKPKINIVLASVMAVVGVGMVAGFDGEGFFDLHTLALLAADICFALYTLSVGKYSAQSSPTFLALGQMLACFVITSLVWLGECAIKSEAPGLPGSPAFVICIIYVGIFLKGIYSVSQVHAQRFISPIETSLIFSTEIIMTMFVSPIIGSALGTEREEITVLRIAGALIVIAGILTADDNIYKKIVGLFVKPKKRENGGKTE